MAIIVSPVWSSIRGSICGITYLTTPAGAIIARQRVKPVNPNSPAQIAVRSGLTGALVAWESATPAQRSDWDAWVLTQSIYRSGREAFIASYTLGAYVNSITPGSVVLGQAAPTNPGILLISDVLPATYTPLADTGVSFSVQNNETESVAYLCQLSSGFPETRNYWTGPWNTVKNQIIISGAGPINTIIDFNGLPVDLRFFMKVRAISVAAPIRVSTAFIIYSLSVTNP
jgi:hypothetical protein